MTDSGWQYPGGGAPPPPPAPPSPSPAPHWDQVPGSLSDPARVAWEQPVYGGGPPTPTPPRWPIMALFGALALLVAAIVGVVVTGGSDDDTVADNDPSDTTASTVPEDDPRAPSGNPNAFIDEEGGYELVLPATWAYTALHGDTAGAGARMFPDNEERAGLAQTTIDLLPRLITFYGVIADEVETNDFVTNININATSAGGETLDYEELAAEITRQIESVDADVTGDDPFELAGAEGVRLEFDYAEAVGAKGVQYAAIIDDQLWVVNFASADVPAHAAEFDTIAASFRVYAE